MIRTPRAISGGVEPQQVRIESPHENRFEKHRSAPHKASGSVLQNILRIWCDDIGYDTDLTEAAGWGRDETLAFSHELPELSRPSKPIGRKIYDQSRP